MDFNMGFVILIDLFAKYLGDSLRYCILYIQILRNAINKFRNFHTSWKSLIISHNKNENIPKDKSDKTYRFTVYMRFR